MRKSLKRSTLVLLLTVILLTAILLTTLLNLGAIKNLLTMDEYDKLRARWKANLVGGTDYDTTDSDIAQRIKDITSSAQSTWDSMDKASGRKYLWSDLAGIADASNITTNYQRILSMALAYSVRGSSLKGDKKLKDDIISAMEWMHTNKYNEQKPENGNWYEWEIGTPLQLNNCTVLMYDDLTDDQRTKYMKAVDRFQPTVTMTGANRVWECTVIAVRGIIVKDGSKLSTARDKLSDVFLYEKAGDGFHEDGSFIQHTSFPYNGGYGLGLLKCIGNIIHLLKDSTWEVTDPNQQNVFKWVYDSFEPFLYKGALMYMISGRDISRHISQDHIKGAAALQSIIRISQFAPPEDAAYFKRLVKYMLREDTTRSFYTSSTIEMITLAKTILSDSNVTPRGELAKYKQFPDMDRAVHLRPGFGFGISMHSWRIYNYEQIIGENLKGWHTADGMTYLYNNDLTQFSDNFWPTVDAYRLPGTTVNQSTPVNNNKPSDKSWVGGVELLGTYGATGMWLHPDSQTLNARKSWFMFDDEIVALGSGITSSDNKVVETIVENRKLNSSGNNTLIVNGTAKSTALGWAETMKETNWIHLEGNVPGSDIGYYFPGGAEVNGLREARTGKWSDINTYPSFTDGTPYTRNYMTLWLDHGNNPSNSSYSYVLLPNMTSSQVSSYADNPNITILENTTDVQAVKENTLNIIGANFWNDISRTVDIITCNKRSSVMLKENAGTDMEVSVSDPTMENRGSIEIEIDRSAAGTLSCDSGITVTQLSPKIKFSVNVKAAKGKTFKVKFSTSSQLQ